jgi:spore coat protein H
MKRNTLITILLISMLSLTGCGTTDDGDEENSTTTQTQYSEAYADSNFTATDWTDATHSKSVDANFTEVFDDTKVKRFDIVVSADRWQSMLDDMTATYGIFGASSTIQTTPSSPPPGGLPGTVPTTTTTVELVDTDEDPIFVPADIYYNGKTWYRAGIRFKGNSSLQTSWEMGILKLSFKLDFDEFEDQYEQIKNQRFYGFKKFSLKNNYDDASQMREKVAADVFKAAGMVVSHTAFYTLYVDHGNGPEYFGLYTLVEEVDGSVLDTQFSSDKGNLYKPEDGSTDFIEGTFSQEDFVKKTNEDDEDWSDIETLFTNLHDSDRTSNPIAWRTALESNFNVDVFLKYLAVNGIIQNWDTYGNMEHNFYLYNDPSSNQLTWIPWDHNEALQEGKMLGALNLDFSNMNSSNWPLIANIYADSVYKTQYDTYLQEVIAGAFETTKMQTLYDTYKTLIEQYATSERAGFTFLNSSSDFTQAVSELKTHAGERATAVDAYLHP